MKGFWVLRPSKQEDWINPINTIRCPFNARYRVVTARGRMTNQAPVLYSSATSHKPPGGEVKTSEFSWFGQVTQKPKPLFSQPHQRKVPFPLRMPLWDPWSYCGGRIAPLAGVRKVVSLFYLGPPFLFTCGVNLAIEALGGTSLGLRKPLSSF